MRLTSLNSRRYQLGFEVIIHQLAVAMTWAFGAFGDYDPTGALVRGRHLPWSEVFNAFARMLLFWTGGSLLFGWAF